MTYFICKIKIYGKNLETFKKESIDEIFENLKDRWGNELHIGNGIIEIIDDPSYSICIKKITEEILYN